MKLMPRTLNQYLDDNSRTLDRKQLNSVKLDSHWGSKINPSYLKYSISCFAGKNEMY